MIEILIDSSASRFSCNVEIRLKDDSILRGLKIRYFV